MNIYIFINTKQKMATVTPQLHSGLGNQLFKMAAAFHFAKKNACAFAIDSQMCQKSPHSRINYLETIFKNIPQLLNYPKVIGQVQEKNCYEYLNLDLTKIDFPLILTGYFQNVDYIEPDFADWLRFGDYKAPIPNLCERYFVHVRRNDYLQEPNYYICDENYYRKALSQLPNNAELVVVSDDIAWCQSSGLFDSLQNTWYAQGLDEISTLKVMSQCERGGICSNSSFSLWGIYLNKNPYKKAIVPALWLKPNTFFSKLNLLPKNIDFIEIK